MTLLDFAKSAVETMTKKILGPTGSRYVHFMLVTCDSSNPVRIGWDQSTNRELFYREVKHLEARDLSDIGTSLALAFDLINRVRLSFLWDNYGLGRLPYSVHMSMVVLITDAGTITTMDGVQDELIVPPTTLSSADFTKEPYRWDQVREFNQVIAFNLKLIF